jgi:DNA-binding transcriptional ArsR family regulator
VHAFDILGDPVRRRILELLADGELPAGSIAASIGDEFGISQPAVSQHLKVLRDNGFATVTVDGTRRLAGPVSQVLDEPPGRPGDRDPPRPAEDLLGLKHSVRGLHLGW